MRAARAVLVLAALLGLTGCSSEDVLPCAAPPPPLPPGRLQPGLVLAGQPVQLLVSASLSFACDSSAPPPPSSVATEVYAPDGTLLPSQARLVNGGTAAIVDFTPEQPGAYHVVVAFSPTGGLHQFDHYALLDRSAQAPRHTLPRRCVDLQRTLQGAWVCDGSLLRGDLPVETFGAARVAVSGDVVWVVDTGRVRRFVDTGSQLTLTASLELPRGTPDFLLPSTDDLLVLRPNILERYTFSAGQLSTPGPTGWEASQPGEMGPRTPRGILLRDGEWLGLVHHSHTSSGSYNRVCPYRITDSGLLRTAEDCTRVPATVSGFEPSVLWTSDSESPVQTGPVRRWVWREGRLQEQGLLVLRTDLLRVDQPLQQRSSAVPVVMALSSGTSQLHPLTAVVAWAPAQSTLVLEHLDGEVVDTLSASPSLFWGRFASAGGNDAMRIRTRSSIP